MNGDRTPHHEARRNAASAEYIAWQSMLGRCYNPRRQHYEYYGGRGIIVCDEWRASFLAFLCDMGRRPSPRHSLDRLDVDGPYCPTNCRWATRIEQARNKRNSRRVSTFGTTLTVAEWAERSGIRSSAIIYRLNIGWPAEQAVSDKTDHSHDPAYMVRGERQGLAKMTATSVLEYRRRRLAGERIALLAAEAGVSLASMKNALSGKTWKHVPMPEAVS